MLITTGIRPTIEIVERDELERTFGPDWAVLQVPCCERYSYSTETSGFQPCGQTFGRAFCFTWDVDSPQNWRTTWAAPRSTALTENLQIQRGYADAHQRDLMCEVIITHSHGPYSLRCPANYHDEFSDSATVSGERETIIFLASCPDAHGRLAFEHNLTPDADDYELHIVAHHRNQRRRVATVKIENNVRSLTRRMGDAGPTD